MSVDPTAFLAELNALGEDEVRLRLAQRRYNSEKGALAHEWLRRIEADRAESARQKDHDDKAFERQVQQGSHRAAWVSNAIAGFALLLSAASFGFSYLAYRESHREPLLLEARRSTADYAAALSPSSLPPTRREDLLTYWDVLLVNNGQQAVSVLSLDIRLLTRSGEMMYSGLVDAILDDGLKPTEPPWSLDSGRPIKLRVRLRLRIDPTAAEVLRTAFPDGQLPSVHRAEMLLADHELDLWGNPLTPIRFDNTVGGFTVQSSSRQPTVAFVVRTARGTTVADSASWYASFDR